MWPFTILTYRSSGMPVIKQLMFIISSSIYFPKQFIQCRAEKSLMCDVKYTEYISNYIKLYWRKTNQHSVCSYKKDDILNKTFHNYSIYCDTDTILTTEVWESRLFLLIRNVLPKYYHSMKHENKKSDAEKLHNFSYSTNPTRRSINNSGKCSLTATSFFNFHTKVMHFFSSWNDLLHYLFPMKLKYRAKQDETTDLTLYSLFRFYFHHHRQGG